jgi:hypothetical protein
VKTWILMLGIAGVSALLIPVTPPGYRPWNVFCISVAGAWSLTLGICGRVKGHASDDEGSWSERPTPQEMRSILAPRYPRRGRSNK